MTRNILFTNENGQQDVVQYYHSEMEEVFTPEQRRALACGEEVDHENRIGSRTVVKSTAIDLVAFANKHRGQRRG